MVLPETREMRLSMIWPSHFYSSFSFGNLAGFCNLMAKIGGHGPHPPPDPRSLVTVVVNNFKMSLPVQVYRQF